MEQNSSSESSSHSVTQGIPGTRVQSPPLDHLLRQMNPLNTSLPHFFKKHFKIILPDTQSSTRYKPFSEISGARGGNYKYHCLLGRYHIFWNLLPPSSGHKSTLALKRYPSTVLDDITSQIFLRFPIKLCALSPLHATCPAHIILLHFITRIMPAVYYITSSQ
jgi:hypothetical protein